MSIKSHRKNKKDRKDRKDRKEKNGNKGKTRKRDKPSKDLDLSTNVARNCIVSPWVLDYIKNHAISSSDEIYGWLIGREWGENSLFILTVLSCERYQQQSSIGAMPDPIEIQEITNSIPSGWGIVGIYHSHPGEIFHSQIDNQTLANFARIYPHLVSAVTNRDVFDDFHKNETRWYQFNPENISVDEITIDLKTPSIEVLQNHQILGIIHIDLTFSYEPNIKQIILNYMLQDYSNVWKNAEFSIHKNSSNYFENFKGINQKMKSDLFIPSNLEELYGFNKVKSFKANEYSSKCGKFIRDLHFFTQVDITFNNRIANGTSEGGNNNIRIKGEIPILKLISLKHDSKLGKSGEWSSLFYKNIVEELRDEMMRKISRSFLVPQDRYFSLVPSFPVKFGYPGTPLIMDVNLFPFEQIESKFTKPNVKLEKITTLLHSDLLPEFQRIYSIEDPMLYSLEQRAIILYSSHFPQEALNLLSKLKEIYLLRNHKANIARIDHQIKNFLSEL